MALSSGAGGEPAGREIEELSVGLVVGEQHAALVEHRDAGGELVERARVRIGEPLQVVARLLEVGDVDGAADRVPSSIGVSSTCRRRRSPATMATVESR